MEFNNKLSGVLASLGITLITAGLSAYLFQSWDNMEVAKKLTLILGYGIITYVLSLYIAHKKMSSEVSATLLIIGVGMIAWGLQIWESARYLQPPLLRFMNIFQSVIALGLFVISWCVGRQIVALTGAIIATQLLYLAVMDLIFNVRLFGYNGLAMGVMLMGFSYVVKQYSWLLSYWLRLIGTLMIGVALYLLGQWVMRTEMMPFFTHAEIMWQALWPVVGIIFVYLGFRLRDNAFFIGGMVSIIGVIFSVAGTYARLVLGLPITLMLFGIISIGVSYGMIHLKHRLG